MNTFDVVMAAAEGPFAQVKELQKGFAAAGKSFNDLSFREQQFLAKQFGIEVQALGAVFDGTIGSQEEFNQSTRTIEDIVQDAVPAIDKLMAGLQGLINFFEPVVSGLASVFQFIGNNISALGPIIVGTLLFSFYKFVKTAKEAREKAKQFQESMMQLPATLTSVAASTQATAASVENLAEKMQSVGQAGDFSWMDDEPLEDLGDAAEEASGKVGDLSESLSENVDMQLKNMDSTQKMLGGLQAATIVTSGLTTGFGLGTAAIDATTGALVKYAGMSEKAARITTSLVVGLGGLVATYFAVGAAKTAAAAGIFAPAALAAYGVAALGIGATIAGAFGVFEGFNAGGANDMSGFTEFAGTGDFGGFEVGEGVDDAIIQGKGQTTKITPINKEDQLLAAKPGGPIANVMGAGGGSAVPERLIQALERVAVMLEKPTDKDINVTVELDRRKMGQAVVAIVDKKLAIT